MAKVVITQPLHEAGLKILHEAGLATEVSNGGTPQEYLPCVKDAEGLIIRIGHIDRAAMEQCPHLKVIGRPGVGVDNVDVKAATELGIPVVIAPGANTRSVAECAFTMMLTAAKDMVRADRELRKGNWALRSEYKAYELYGKTLGLVGCGHIGNILASLCSAIGMSVMVYDPFLKREVVEAQGYAYYENLNDILKNADVVSLHVPLTEQTRDLIGAHELSLMKSTAILINCARGGIINEKALYEALSNHQIMACALDVFEHEPVKPDDPLLTLDNIIVCPHMAGQTREAAAGVAAGAAEGVAAVIAGQKWPKVCNPEVYNHPRWQKED